MTEIFLCLWTWKESGYEEGKMLIYCNMSRKSNVFKKKSITGKKSVLEKSSGSRGRKEQLVESLEAAQGYASWGFHPHHDGKSRAVGGKLQGNYRVYHGVNHTAGKNRTDRYLRMRAGHDYYTNEDMK